jgi:general secretion pathway protein I
MMPDCTSGRDVSFPANPDASRFEDAKSGFTLIEVLVAMVILGLALGVIMISLRNATLAIATTAQQTKALAIAQSLLAAEGQTLPLQYGETDGVTRDNFRWRIVTTPWGTADDIAARLAGGYQVAVTVTQGARSITLTTLRAGPVANAN